MSTLSQRRGAVRSIILLSPRDGGKPRADGGKFRADGGKLMVDRRLHVRETLLGAVSVDRRLAPSVSNARLSKPDSDQMVFYKQEIDCDPFCEPCGVLDVIMSPCADPLEEGGPMEDEGPPLVAEPPAADIAHVFTVKLGAW